MKQDHVYAGTVLLVGFTATERQQLGVAMAPSGYASVSWSISEALDRGARCPIHAAVIDCRRDLAPGLRQAREVRLRGDDLPLILLVRPSEHFVYRRTRSLGRVVVLYAPVGATRLLDALDALTTTTARPSRPFAQTTEGSLRGSSLGSRVQVG